LNSELLKLLTEHQIYRIDHYLGKETVQNILVLRFANGMFEPIWNRNHIDHIQITVDEKLGSVTAAASTTQPARCAIWCRTTCSSCSPGSDGAADPLRRAFGAFGEGQRAGRDPDPERR
jgi:hypothetical protein